MKKPDYFTWEERKSAEAYLSELYWQKHADPAIEGILASRKKRITAPISPWVSDRDVCDLAQARADLMVDRIAALPGLVTLDWLNKQLVGLEARPFKDRSLIDTPEQQEKDLQANVLRSCCRLFWRKQLRRAQVQKREAQEQAAGRVNKAAGQPYVTDVTDSRYGQRQAANRAMLEATEIESEHGEIMTLWDAVQVSTANKSIRRGELMTRIRGCEEWATSAGMVGIFTTNTLPSRFHAALHGGGINPNFTGDTPKDGQAWLSKTWAKCRSKIKRKKIKVFGFRVAEPHHDGCPHWHMLLWVSAEQVQQLKAMMRDYWLADSGNEPGAQEYRFKAETIDPARGGAIAYVAKYIAKNTDDFGAVGTEGHRDGWGDQQELIEGGNKARRAQAWASAWNIRQFQAIGQPPVTVWRELRRVEADMVAGASKRLQAAHKAVHKADGHRASWCDYMTAQGGAMNGRDYQLRLEFDEEQHAGAYGETTTKRPAGVFDVARPGELCTSNRARWKKKGHWSPQDRSSCNSFAEILDSYTAQAVDRYLNPAPVPTWTRFNNCTPDPKKSGFTEFDFSGFEPGGGEIPYLPEYERRGDPVTVGLELANLEDDQWHQRW